VIRKVKVIKKNQEIKNQASGNKISGKWRTDKLFKKTLSRFIEDNENLHEIISDGHQGEDLREIITD
jgi:hypothetical protein